MCETGRQSEQHENCMRMDGDQCPTRVTVCVRAFCTELCDHVRVSSLAHEQVMTRLSPERYVQTREYNLHGQEMVVISRLSQSAATSTLSNRAA